MKKLFALGFVTFALCNQHASAQIGKGQMMLGGGVAVMSDKTKTENGSFGETESTSTTIGILPQVGFGVGGNWVIGLNPGFTTQKETEKNLGGGEVEQKISIVTIGVYARKFHPIGERFGIFGQLNAGYGFSTTKTTNGVGNESKWKGNLIEIGARPGAYLKAGKRFIVEATIGNIGYTRVSNEPENSDYKTTTGQFEFTLANSLGLAFHVIL